MSQTMVRTVFVFFLALTAFGCVSDAETICQKADECNILVGQSESECVERAEKDRTEGELADCVDCIDGKSCSTLVRGACAAACFF
jgi:hypothetical protein